MIKDTRCYKHQHSAARLAATLPQSFLELRVSVKALVLVQGSCIGAHYEANTAEV